MPPRRDEDADRRPVDGAASRRSPLGGARSLPLIAGFVLAAAATLAVFLTDNAQYLRVAVVAVAWAFVLATFAAGRRQADRAAAAAREAELHRAYEAELDREVAARHEYELELENDLRRETEESMRAELDALRADLAGLSDLRAELARVTDLHGDLAALGALREEVARVAALRDDVAALTALRGELGQLAELRADMGRLRVELVERLAGEMHVERITMRTQASRLPADQGRDGGVGRTLDAAANWSDGAPPRELTGGWPAVRLDEPGETRQFEAVRPRETTAPRSWDAAPPATTAWPASPPPWSAEPAPDRAEEAPPYRPEPYSAEPYRAEPYRYEEPSWSAPDRADPQHRPSPRPSRPAAETVAPSTQTPQPVEWLAARSLLDARPPVPEPPAAKPAAPPPPATAAYGFAEQPATRSSAPSSTPPPPPPGESRPTTGSLRVSDILAENGMSPATGGRRRRRYRDEDTSDDVLSRVLGRN
jgi:hypothetical protein